MISKHKGKWLEATRQRSIISKIERWVSEDGSASEDEWDWRKDSSERQKPGPWRDNATSLTESSVYQSWYKSEPDTPERFLWAIGTMGMAKSVLMNEIVWQHRNHRRDGSITVEIYFDIRDPFFIGEFLVCLLMQILGQVKSSTPLMNSIHDEIEQKKARKRDDDTLYHLLKELTAQNDIYFFLDGLEDFNDHLATAIADSLTHLGPRHRVICFSEKAATVDQSKFPEFSFWDLPGSKPDPSNQQ